MLYILSMQPGADPHRVLRVLKHSLTSSRDIYIYVEIKK